MSRYPPGEAATDAAAACELVGVFSRAHVSAFWHPQQRHSTFDVRSPDVHAIAKLYGSLDVAAVGAVASAEQLVRAADVPVPRELYRSSELPLIVHEYVEGEHRTDPSPPLIGASAAAFVKSVLALAGFRASWAPPRPADLPRRAQVAEASTVDTQLVQEIRSCWQMLYERAVAAPGRACHSDWRADNMLCRGEEVAAVLDWESLVHMPACEAMGYAAAAVSHSWRDDLYRPVEVEPVLAFLAAAEREWTAAGGIWCARLAYAASRYSGAVRLAEDRARGCEVLSLDTLRRSLRE